MKRPAVLNGAGPAGYRLAVVKAWRRLADGNGTRDDFAVALHDLKDAAGYLRRPKFADWLAKTKTPDGFELHSALTNARAEVVQVIIDCLDLDDDEIVRLEKSAQAEARG